jgi:hypothetical protein
LVLVIATGIPTGFLYSLINANTHLSRVGWHYFEADDQWKRHRRQVAAVALQNFQWN